jgi:hypothetical protein
MVNAGTIGVLLVIVIMGTGFGSYFVTSTRLNSEVSSYQNTISNLQSTVSFMSANPSTTTIYSTDKTTSTTTATAISYSTITTTTTSISITTSTTTEYPIPNNVTFLLVYSSGCGNQGDYQISVNGQAVASGSAQSGTNSSIPLSQLYEGDKVSITFGIGSYYYSCTSNEQGYLFNSGNQVGYAEDTSNYNQQSSALITWTS